MNGGLVAQAERRNPSCCLPLLIVLYSSAGNSRGKESLQTEIVTSPKGNVGLTEFSRPGGLMSLTCFFPSMTPMVKRGFMLD